MHHPQTSRKPHHIEPHKRKWNQEKYTKHLFRLLFSVWWWWRTFSIQHRNLQSCAHAVLIMRINLRAWNEGIFVHTDIHIIQNTHRPSFETEFPNHFSNYTLYSIYIYTLYRWPRKKRCAGWHKTDGDGVARTKHTAKRRAYFALLICVWFAVFFLFFAVRKTWTSDFSSTTAIWRCCKCVGIQRRQRIRICWFCSRTTPFGKYIHCNWVWLH